MNLVPTLRPLASFLLIAGLAGPAFAADTIADALAYQGRLQLSGTNLNGSFHFKFSLVDGTDSAVLWTNDGGQAGAGGEPVGSVVLAVTNGLFRTTLGGDPMVPVPPTVFARSKVLLRVWVQNAGAYVELTPASEVSPVGAALVAKTVVDGAVGTSALADGAVTLAKIDSATIASLAIAGPVGPVGPTGPAGAVGAQGPVGPAGAIGPAGAAGALGPAGAIGPVGAQGPAGPVGPAGADGGIGAQGPVGPAGAIGPVGAQGPVGPAGATGPAGAQGPAGPAGAQGPVGPAGATGAPGAQGLAGPAGATGPAGAAGIQGPAGAAGATWLTGTGIPGTGLGVNGDLYLDTDAADIYRKAAGAWGSSIANLHAKVDMVVYTVPRDHTLVVPPAAFRAQGRYFGEGTPSLTDVTDVQRVNGIGGIYLSSGRISQDGILSAPVILPDKARITGMLVYFSDSTSSYDLTADLIAVDPLKGTSEVVATGAYGELTDRDSTGAPYFVDLPASKPTVAEGLALELQISSTYDSGEGFYPSWPYDAELVLNAVKITYQLDEAQ